MIAFHDVQKENIMVAFANYAVLSWSLLQACKTIPIAFVICKRFILSALASTWHHHGHNCESMESIAIVQAICRRKKHLGRLLRTSQSHHNCYGNLQKIMTISCANYWVSMQLHLIICRSPAVAFCNLAGLLHCFLQLQQAHCGCLCELTRSLQSHL